MVSILGAGGVIGNGLVREFLTRQEPVRIVSRAPKADPGVTETMAADISNPEDALRAVSGCRVAFLVAGLPYDLKVWQASWPRIMRNTIEACKKAAARLVFFDNVYMYGKVDGPMTEETPFRPCSGKGEVRAEIATLLLEEIKAGSLSALIARAPDFYGPGVRTALPTVLVFDKLAKGARPMCLGNPATRHSYTFTPDAARGVALLAGSESAWNQTWHVPTAADPPTGKQFIDMAGAEFGTPRKCRVLSRPLLRVAGWFDPTIRELREMLYQNEFDFVFDSTKFEKAFDFRPTSYAKGVRKCVEAYRQ